MTTCPATDCGKPISKRLLMCLPCWRLVPKDVQRRVYAAHKTNNALAWLEARGEAIQAVDAYNRSDR